MSPEQQIQGAAYDVWVHFAGVGLGGDAQYELRGECPDHQLPDITAFLTKDELVTALTTSCQMSADEAALLNEALSDAHFIIPYEWQARPVASASGDRLMAIPGVIVGGGRRRER